MSDPEITPELLAKLLTMGEGRTLDLKEIWPDLGTPQARAELVKDVLAFANTLELGEAAHIIFGVKDPKRGGDLVGVLNPPSPDQVSQILADYTVPPPRTYLRNLQHSGITLSVLTIVGSGTRPHHAVRQYTSVLNPTIIYVRRDGINGVATSQEVEGMILKKLGRPGHLIDQAPLKVGFVGQGHTQGNRTLIVRVTNIADSAVAGVDVLIDFQHIGLPALAARERLLTNMTLGPAETREAQISLSGLQFAVRNVEMTTPATIRVVAASTFTHHVGDGWLNATLRVYYRDDDGFLHELTRELALDV